MIILRRIAELAEQMLNWRQNTRDQFRGLPFNILKLSVKHGLP